MLPYLTIYIWEEFLKRFLFRIYRESSVLKETYQKSICKVNNFFSYENYFLIYMIVNSIVSIFYLLRAAH